VESRPILLVTNDLGPRAGGIESFILGLLGELDGSQISIFTSSQSGDRAFDDDLHRRLGVVIHRDRAKILLPTPRVNRAVAAQMREYSAQTIWYGSAAPLGWMSGYLRRVGAKRQVALTHGHEVWWSKIWPFSWIMRRISGHLDVITYLGEFTLKAMQPALDSKVAKIRIAPGINVDHFTPAPKPEDLVDSLNLAGKKVILSVGRLVHRKGQDKLIEAMPLILQAEPQTILILVGEGPHKDHLLKLVAKYQLEGFVRFIGRLHYEDLPRYLRLGDIFAMPSRSRFFGLEVEGLGIVYLEASACGIPVLGGASGGAPDAVLSGETGLVVDGRDVQAIAQSAIVLLKDSELRKGMGERGRAWALEQWSWKIWGERFRAVLLGE
jgi:phosphatidyl-myo-inositol dimannoside synthase